MRIFGSDRLDSMLRKLGVAEGEAISHAWISKALERAQQKVEARNFDIRKHLLRYDDVMNDQRKIIYQQRLEIMKADDMSPMIEAMRHETIQDVVHEHIPENALVDDWDLDGLHSHLLHIFNVDLPIREWANSEGIAESEITERAIKAIDESAKKREEEFGSEKMRHAEKSVLLRTLDTVWKEHLLVLDHLRQGINLRAYAQSNPLNEYKREAFSLFQTMLKFLREDVSGILSRVDAPQDAEPEDVDDMIMPQIDLEKLEELLPGWLAENAEALSDQPFPEIIKQITRALDEKALLDSNVKIESDVEFEEKPKAKKESAKKSASPKKATATAVKKTSDKESKKSTDSKKEVSKTVKVAKASTKKATPSVDPKDPTTWGELPRNADCPCGSGKKYKHCHGAI
jgi:preprotein translocase subunit SecA